MSFRDLFHVRTPPHTPSFIPTKDALLPLPPPSPPLHPPSRKNSSLCVCFGFPSSVPFARSWAADISTESSVFAATPRSGGEAGIRAGAQRSARWTERAPFTRRLLADCNETGAWKDFWGQQLADGCWCRGEESLPLRKVSDGLTNSDFYSIADLVESRLFIPHENGFQSAAADSNNSLISILLLFIACLS